MTTTAERKSTKTDKQNDSTAKADKQNDSTAKADKQNATTAKTTGRQNAERGFKASAELTNNLQRVLTDLIELTLQSKQAHWNVVGKNFRDLHLQLDEIVAATRGFSDDVAERLRGLHATPDGRSDTIAGSTTLPEYPAGEVDTAETVDLITERLEATVGTIREVHDDVDDEDPTSADLLHAILERLEQLAWMVSAENRKPSKK